MRRTSPDAERKRRIGVLISGRGSNMVALAEACAAESHPATIALVASDQPDAPGLLRAAELGLATAALNRSAFSDRASFETALHRSLINAEVEIICLAGFMRILSADFVSRWRDQILNIHPSLLPLFPGLDTHARAIEAGVKVHGASVHVVTSKVDDGRIVAQVAIAVQPDDTAETLANRLLPLEHMLYPHALEIFLGSRAGGESSTRRDETVLFSPPVAQGTISIPAKK